MKPFLQIVSEHIYNNYADNLSKLCIVFPNRRAVLYFNKYLSKQVEKPIWTPAYFTINELFKELSNFQQADDIYLIFNLYKVFKRIKKTEETFDNFYHWGEMLLNDFDEIDKYLINPKDLFQNLKNLKAIHETFHYLTHEQLEAIKSYWQSFSIDQYSKHQKDFISVWEILFQVYTDFKKSIQYDNQAFEGMIYREVSDNIEITDFNKFEKYIFVGFNALNKCEKKLFNYLHKTSKALFYWDYDEYYIKNKFFEAGYFLKKNLIEFPNALSNDLYKNLTTPKNINFVSVSSNIAQVETIDFLFKKNKINQNTLNNTAIVLADEQLLVPVLHSIPDDVNEINASMGYPLQHTPVYSFFENLIDLQKNSRLSKNKEDLFYFQHVISIFNHQYIKIFDTIDVNNCISQLLKQNKIYILKSELPQNYLVDLIFSKKDSVENFSQYILDIFRLISLKFKESDKSDIIKNLEIEFIYSLYLAINRLDDIIKKHDIKIKIETYTRLLRRIIRNIRIPFVGEPLKGLQIIGILETRTIDFKNVIVLSANEGVFPKSRVSSSFIPYNLRKGFGLPTIQNQDSIFGYYFYRLIQRAKNVSLVYSTKSEGIATGEMSRFLYQLKYNNDFKISELNLDFNISTINIKPIKIEKNDKILHKLYAICGEEEGRYLSPSAINNYIDCRLKFYYKYIEGIDEPDEIHEEVEPVDFGNILHSSMQQIYNPYINKELNEKNLNEILANNKLIENVVTNSFQKVYFKSNTKTHITARNTIIKEVIIKYINEIIKFDKNLVPIIPLSLEKKYLYSIQINEKAIIIGGMIDRIDKTNGKLRIIDYKTGRKNLSFGEIIKLFAREDEKRNSAAFQMLLYNFLYNKINNQDDLVPSLYFIQELFKTDFTYKLQKKEGKSNVEINSYSEVKDEFEENIFNLLNEIINPDIPFDQVDNEKICKYCPYKVLCQR